jgi:hypothetical protein
MKSKILLKIILSFITALAIAIAAAYASEPLSVRGHPTSTGTAPKRLALATVTEIQDSVLTVKVNDVVHNALMDDKTKITRNGKPAALSDIKTGMKVRITFIERSGSKIATTIEISSGAGPETAKPIPALPPPPGTKTVPALRR